MSRHEQARYQIERQRRQELFNNPAGQRDNAGVSRPLSQTS